MRSLFIWGMSLAVLAANLTLAADQPPIGVAPVQLQGAYEFDTAEQHGIRVTLLARDLTRSFGLAFLPDGDLLVSVRGGPLRVIHDATGTNPVLDPVPVAGLPTQDGTSRNGGLQDIALHPDFASNHLLYFTYNKHEPVAAGATPPQQLRGAVTLMRARYENGRLEEAEELFAGGYGGMSGSRIAFANDGTIYMTTSGPNGEVSQQLDSVYGKVLRLNDDGSIPADNPFVGKQGANPAIYAYGFRDQLGLAVDKASGTVFAADHGMNGGDEVNLLKPGANYGWPTHSFSRNYQGVRVSELPVTADIEQPQILWSPSIGPSGMNFYTGDNFPAWKGNLFVASARRGEVDRTGGLERVVFNDSFGDIRRETLLTELHQRIRQVVQGPDGNLYVLTDGDEYAVLRIEPN
jgi:glucose/arabinose dehydrogenase